MPKSLLSGKINNMIIEKKQSDSRTRYLYKLCSNNIELFVGYLLHEEAWAWLVKQKEGSIHYEKNNTSNISELIKKDN